MDIFPHMEVVDADGQHVGIVESVDGDLIKLFKKEALDRRHAFIERNQVAGIEDNKIVLSQKISAITTRAFVSENSGEE